MRRVALLIAWLAACGGGSGVDIDIYPPEGVTIDKVELWIAYDACSSSDCPNGVAWTEKERADGAIYFLRDEMVVEAKPLDDRWVLHLQATAGNRDPSWIAVAGYDKGVVKAVKVLRSVRIPATNVDLWKVYLHAADPATPELTSGPSDAAHTYRAHAWARQPTAELAEPTGCLVYQKWNETAATWDTEYFVPKSDPDCDGQRIECAEYWFDYKPLGRCVADVGLALADVCAIGATTCADGVSDSRTCGNDAQRAFTCLPDAFCETCAGMIPADTCIGNAVETGLAANTLPHYDCAFDATAEGAPCTAQPVTLQLPHVQASCGTPAMHYLDRPFTEPQSSLLFGVAPDDVKLVAKSNPAGACLVDLFWLGGTAERLADGITFLLDVPYDNGTRTIYTVVVKPSNQTITCGLANTSGICTVDGPTADRVGLCATK